MPSFPTNFAIDAALIARAFRRSTIDALVRSIKLACLVLAALALGLAVYRSVQDFTATSTLELRLQNDLQTLIAESAPKAVTKREEKQDYNAIAEKKLFGEVGAKPTAAPVAPVKPVSNISLALIGTFITDGQAPYAIIEDTKKSMQEVFNLKESIFGDANLVSIFNDHVEIERNGQIEILTIDENAAAPTSFKEGVATSGEDSFVIEEAELDKAMENLPLLLTQARAVPYFQDGKAVGLRLFAIRSGSLFEKIGLMNGDILKSINGNSLADFSQAMTLFQKLKEERSIGVMLERNKQDRDFKYTIK